MSTTASHAQSRAICVIFNPAAGRRRARQRLEAISHGWRQSAEFWPTELPGHAVELAQRACKSGFGVVAAAGGDGTVHEVANGVLRSGREDLCFAVIPLGSADDYAYSLKCDQADDGSAAGRARLVDVGLIRTDTGAERFFVCCASLGFAPCVTLESHRIGWLQGRFLYGLAAVRAMCLHWGYLHLTGSLDDVPIESDPCLSISVMIGRREGGFVMAPDARLDDGWFDLVRAGRLTRWQALCLIPSLSSTGPPRDHPKLSFHRGRRLVVDSQEPLVIHTDGEILCRSEDGVRHAAMVLSPRRLLVRLGLEDSEYLS
jgi:diacylglycerol kinase family enzyme